ncbi:Type II secretion system protein D precursor [Pelagimonas phthalicica]|uniref:Type II secretion system protein D n=1 Tax=Pelagimonas phthalicica TaxID=1037362 RepID=A0A238J7F5_9RHOB|nr:type II secretion system secretin GspD [Pelagimonas phthalicica]TDS95389.1 type II secretion system protein D (GspD) [Pelagimonas phthalicica]SMX26087.1 Type II secretion system protein D precursor [Pelagimonas phthalicica]
MMHQALQTPVRAGFSVALSHLLRGCQCLCFFLLFLCISATFPSKSQAQVTLNLRDADLRNFVEIVSEATGRSFVLDPGVRGTVTVLSPEEMSNEDLYQVFLSVLELNRLTIVDGAGADRIVPLNSARELATSGDALPGGFETRVIRVHDITPQEAIEVVRPLLPSEAIITAVPGSDRLILSDRGANIDRIAKLIDQLDKPSKTQPIEILRLSNANAAEVMQVIQAMEILEDSSTVTVDRRSNALLISGSEAIRHRVRVLVAELDTQRDTVVSRAIPLNYADATSIAEVVMRTLNTEDPTGVREPIRIVPELQTNSLLVSAPQERISDIAKMIHYLDQRPKQVLVEAVIFEMSVEGLSDLSVQFGAILNDALVGGAQFALPGRTSLINLISAVTSGTGGDPGNGGVLAVNHRRGNDGLIGLLTAITSLNSTRLLSTPSVLTLNNEEAEIVVAQNVPFVTGSFSTVGESAVENPFQTIERQDVGLTLNVTPQINADRTVRLLIKQEVSNLTSDNASSGGEITTRRSLSTTVLVRDGSVIMLGGLLENGNGSVSQRVPGLSKLPVLGALFKGKNSNKSQRVLLMLIRPQVVTSDAEARRITRQVTKKAKEISTSIAPLDDGSFPKSKVGGLPFDGADLNQPFDAGFVDDVAQRRNYPPLPSRLKFGGH